MFELCIVVDVGHAACFSGNILHSGDAVLSGCRYIIAAFFVMFDLEGGQEDNRQASTGKKVKVGNDQSANASFSFDFF